MKKIGKSSIRKKETYSKINQIKNDEIPASNISIWHEWTSSYRKVEIYA